MAAEIEIEAPARLHFGVLDLRGSLGRSFGGLGAAVPSPSLRLRAEPSATISAEGPDAERAAEFAERFRARHGLEGGVRLTIERAIPAHAGLGSGTQLGLAVARAMAELHGLGTDPAALARAVGRGARSAIGTWAFAHGGFLVEGGRVPGADGPAPLLARYRVPPGWRCVLAIPEAPPGLSGAAEAAAFRELPPPPEREVERVAHLVLMQLLPALVEADLRSFGSALTEIQRVTGGWFAPRQGGTFAPGPTSELIARMPGWGALGVGQSSWGPTAYGLVEGDAAAGALAERVAAWLGARGRVLTTGFSDTGARIRRREGTVQSH